MQRVHRLSAIVILGLLTGCGSAAAVTTAANTVARPTAFAVTAAATPAVATAAPKGDAPTSRPAGAAAPAQAATPSRPSATPASGGAKPTPSATPATSRGEPVPASRADFKIVIDAPTSNAAISSPLPIRGSTNFWPFEATLVAQLKDAAGNVLAMKPVMVQSPDIGQGGPWADELSFMPPASAQAGTLEIFETSAKDGSITTIASVKVRLAPGAKPGTTLSFDQPDDGAVVTLPLHVAFRGARGDEQLSLRLTAADGKVLQQMVRAQLGYIVANISGAATSGPATLEIARSDGTLLARRTLRIAAPEETQTVKVAWAVRDAEEVTLQTLRVPRTSQVATAALNELLWGPVADDAGYSTALPTPAEVLSYPGRTTSWGARVRLLKLTITDGVALANFSPELRAYGGGAARVAMIRKQIETTLRQFPSVKEVVIAIEGQTEGVLEP